jgi:hypothetical protein
MVLVAGTRWASRGKDTGSLDSGGYRGDRGRRIAALQRGIRGQLLFRQTFY